MADYSGNAKALIHGLSDFWLQYFRERPILEEIYRGAEIEIGQSYLDLMALLLNNSVQDATLFNKNFFKLLRLREDAVVYSADGTYSIALDGNVAGLKYLHNKVFAVTEALERDVDFTFDEASRSLVLPYDPFSVYASAEFGTGPSALVLRSAQPRAQDSAYSVSLIDFATPTLQMVSTAAGVAIVYAGPSNGALHTAADIVQFVNTDPRASALLSATLPETSPGTASPVGGTKRLTTVSRSPLRGFALYESEVLFGTQFTDPGVSNWMAQDVRKGDVLRILGGPGYGEAQEFPVALVREGALYLYPQAAPVDLSGKLEYSILRSPVDAESTGEALAPLGLSISGSAFPATASVTAATQTLTFSAPLSLGPEYVGDAIVLQGVANAGEYRVVEIVSPTTWRVIGAPMTDEAGIDFTVYTPLQYVSTANASPENDGLSTVTTGGAFFTPANTEGAVLRLVSGGTTVSCRIQTYVSPSTVIVECPEDFLGGIGIRIGLADFRPYEQQLAYHYPHFAPFPGTVTLTGRLLANGQLAVEGRDYRVDYDRGLIRFLSVFQATSVATVSYTYRQYPDNNPFHVATGSSGSFLGTGPYVFQDLTADFTVARPGYALRVTGSDAANRGTYYVDAVLSPTQVRLTDDHSPVLPDSQNGSIDWTLHRAGGVAVDVYERVNELGVWAVDAKIDEYHLYFTYGYLVNRIQASRSSEAYRSLVRGLFQLFMLGPTLERFESAINTVAGLEVIRDDGERLLSYSSGALRSGNDGGLSGTTHVFTSATAAFTPGDLSNRIYITNGANANKQFSILAVLSPTQVELGEVPTTQTGAGWEITANGTQSITTSRATYTYPRTVPLKEKFTDPSNWGVLSLQPFEVVTRAFEVTDYVETPLWWERARIPAVLAPDYSQAKRQSTPTLFKNVFDAPDGPSYGDPGLFYDADDSGVYYPPVILQAGLNGQLEGDPLFPISTSNTFFYAAGAVFLPVHVGNYIRLDYPVPESVYRITEWMAPDRVRVETYTPWPTPPAINQAWEHITGTVPLRHTAAYVVLDRFLKHHLFTVRFDASLLELLPSNVIQDLQRLVFEAKPTYTYLLLTPSSIFEDVVRVIEEELDLSASVSPSGAGGMRVLGNRNPLLYDSGYLVYDSWFRYVENTDTFLAPSGTVSDLLGVPDTGYRHVVSKVFLEPTEFQLNGAPLPYDAFVSSLYMSGLSGSLSVAGGVVQFLPGLDVFPLDVTFGYLTIANASNPSNNGTYRVGRMASGEAVIDNPAAITEGGLEWYLHTTGGMNGVTSTSAEGESFFTGEASHPFDGAAPNTYVRRIYTAANLEEAFRIDEVITNTRVRIAERTQLLPTQGAATPYTGAVAGNVITVGPSDFIFDPTMTYNNRRAASPTTARVVQYFVEFLSGANTGEVRELSTYLTPNTVQVSGTPLAADAAVDLQIFQRRHYTVAGAGGAWEQVARSAYVDTGDYPTTPTDRLTVVPTADAGTVSYTAYGTREPIDPASETFDATAGDTYFVFDGVDPRVRYMRSRTGRDLDLQEHPLQVTRTETPSVMYITVNGDYLTSNGDRVTLG